MADPKALLDRFRGRIRQLVDQVSRLYGGEPDDAYQVAMIEAWRLAETYDPSYGSFFSYIYRAVRGAAIDACVSDLKARRVARAIERAAAPVDMSMELGDPFNETEAERQARLRDLRDATLGATAIAILATPATPEELLATEQRRATIRAALNKLDPSVRAFIWDVGAEGMSISAAARKHAIPDREARTIHKNAETALGRSLRELRPEVAGTKQER